MATSILFACQVTYELLGSMRQEPPPFPPQPNAPPVIGSPFLEYVIGVALLAWILARSGLRLRNAVLLVSAVIAASLGALALGVYYFGIGIGFLLMFAATYVPLILVAMMKRFRPMQRATERSAPENG